MAKEFNPNRENLLTLDQLILDVKSKKDKLIKTKIGIQNSLSETKDKYKDVEFEGAEFYKIKETRFNLKKAVGSVEIKIKTLNEELIFKNKLRNEIIFHLKHNKSLEGKEDLDKIINSLLYLKKKYSEFTKDRTRISSLRIMASEFEGEIDKILKT